MEGANFERWILIVIGLLGHLMHLSGFLGMLSSNTNPGMLLQIFGAAIIVPVNFILMASSDQDGTISSAARRRLKLRAGSIQAFGSICAMISQLWFAFSDGNKKSLLWLGITGSFLMFIGQFLHAVNTFKVQGVQQMNGSEDTKESVNDESATVVIITEHSTVIVTV